MVITRTRRSRDELQAHYTSSSEIVEYMVSKLGVSDADFVWEPCAGEGDLIDGVLSVAPRARIHASEIDETAFKKLRNKYLYDNNVTACCEDALDIRNDMLFSATNKYTRIIANPPYGAYQSPARRLSMKKRFPALYVRETYGLILFHSLSLLSKQGRLVFIIPDTFLWLHRHDFLRRTLFKNTTIEEIALFPSKFFPGVNFGYSGMCVITLRNSVPSENHVITVYDKIRESKTLCLIARQANSALDCQESSVVQHEILNRPHAELNTGNQSLENLDSVQREKVLLSEVAEVRTGFYSGNDRRWIKRLNCDVRRSKQYEDVDNKCIFSGNLTLDGIEGTRHFIPIVRGGAAQFFRRTQWFVDWSKEAVEEYRRPGKNPARFQNSHFYFKEGIGVPMVASSRLSAAELGCRLFDQGIVGVFPIDMRLSRYLLGFLNTKLATLLLRQINPTANNSANYLKRLQIVIPTAQELNQCDNVVETALQEARNMGLVSSTTLGLLESLYREIWTKEKA